MSISLGPYSSWDAQLEFAAAANVVQWGFPYTTYGHLINMQPLGLYIDALFLSIFGISYETAVAVTTVFALGCVLLTYELGALLYGKRTGLFAAALFALTPWQLILSRVFLVDVQCLFFSLLFLLIGLLAIKKDSLKLFFVAGVFFGFALLTKLFAVFMLIPLSLIYIYKRPKNRRSFFIGIILFFLPAFLIQYLWYEPISGRGLLSLLNHDDFTNYLPDDFAPSPFFSLSFLSESLGAFFVLGYLFSILVSFFQRKQFRSLFVFDLTCFATVIGVLGFNEYLVFGYNMLVPYVNSIKYNYLLLPLFCLLAASAAKKCSILSRTKRESAKDREIVVYLAAIGPYLLLVSMIFNFFSLTTLLKYDWLTFNVFGGLSYSFDRLSPILSSGRLWALQLLGFVIIQLSLLWTNRKKIESLFASL